jgi:hypothetical protein
MKYSSIDELRREISEKHKLWAIANPEEAKERSEKLAAGIRDIPVKQMYDQLQYIEKELLPAVRKKNREADIKFFEGVCRSLAYGIAICDRYEYLHLRYINSRIDVAMLKDHLSMSEKELERYTTMEDLFLSDFMNKYAEKIAERVKHDILRVK